MTWICVLTPVVDFMPAYTQADALEAGVNMCCIVHGELVTHTRGGVENQCFESNS